MNDRLGDLGLNDNEPVPLWTPNSNGDLESGRKRKSFRRSITTKKLGKKLSAKKKNGQSDELKSFFRNVSYIEEGIDALKQATSTVQRINDESLLAISTAKEDDLSRELKSLISATSTRAKRTKDLLETLEDENSKLDGRMDVNRGDVRIRKNLCYTLMKKFLDETKLYQAAQQKYKTDIRQKVKRQVQAVQPDATDDDIDVLMSSGEGRDALIQQTMLHGRTSDSVKSVYFKVAGKYQDVLTLEASVAELHQMFLDLSLLTKQQGEMMDQIEFHVIDGRENVQAANKEIEKAIRYQKRGLKKKV